MVSFNEMIVNNPSLYGWESVLDSLRKLNPTVSFLREGKNSFAGRMLVSAQPEIFVEFTVDWSNVYQISIISYGLDPRGELAALVKQIFSRLVGCLVVEHNEPEKEKRLEFITSVEALP